MFMYDELKENFNKEYPNYCYRTHYSKFYYNGELMGYEWRIYRIDLNSLCGFLFPVMSGTADSRAQAEYIMAGNIARLKRDDRRDKRRAWRAKKKEYREAMPFSDRMTYRSLNFLFWVVAIGWGMLLVKWIVWAILG